MSGEYLFNCMSRTLSAILSLINIQNKMSLGKLRINSRKRLKEAENHLYLGIKLKEMTSAYFDTHLYFDGIYREHL